MLIKHKMMIDQLISFLKPNKYVKFEFRIE